MTNRMAFAVFDTQSEAERAVSELRDVGLRDSDITLISQHDGKHRSTDGSGHDTTQDFLGKAALGAGVGTALGIAALAIPGVGPLVAAGAIAAAAVPTAAVAGAAAGLAAGTLASAMSDRGIQPEDSEYAEQRIGEGGVLVTVDTAEVRGSTAAQVQDILYRNGGHTSTRQKSVDQSSQRM